MVLAYHIIFTAYGFWLPNDPRGSWSDYVASWDLHKFGNATTTSTRRSVAGRAHDHSLRQEAKAVLKYPPVRFTGRQALAIAGGFARAIADAGCVLWALSILPDHVHGVLQRPAQRAEIVVGRLKALAARQLRAQGLHPFADIAQSPWAQRCWKVFLNTDADIRRAIAYVQANPAKEGKRPQHWSFVTPY
jgi:REP element-mobilizing transposase RayT